MNKIEKTISLELAKKISEIAKKKGVELPESEYFRIEGSDDIWTEEEYEKENLTFEYERTSAFDTSELGEMLPNQIVYRKDFIISTKKIIYSVSIPSMEIKEMIFGYTEAEARGKMYLYLLENDLLIKEGCI